MILEKLKKICKQVMFDSEINFDNITEKSRLDKDLCFNSISLLILAIAIEEEFSIIFPTTEAANCIYVGDIINIISGSLNEKKK